MTVLLATVAGFLAGRLIWVMLRPSLAHATFQRLNYRERSVPTAGGLVLPLAVVGIEAGRTIFGAAGVGEVALSGTRLAVLTATMTFALLGLLDDLGAAGDARGFRGHVAAIGRGRLTTGAAKLAGGGAVAVVLVALLDPAAGLAGILRDAAIVALAANAANLFDRAPGRVLKVAAASFVVLIAGAGGAAALGAVGVVVGAALALTLDDLRERVMLGDTGANAIGAALGLGVVVAFSPAVRTGVVVALVVVNAVSEFVSFSRVIDGFPPFRVLDRLGRRR